jgi:hypothetical protein
MAAAEQCFCKNSRSCSALGCIVACIVVLPFASGDIRLDNPLSVAQWKGIGDERIGANPAGLNNGLIERTQLCPVAKPLIHADSHNQLDSNLFALNRAMSAEQQAANEYASNRISQQHHRNLDSLCKRRRRPFMLVINAPIIRESQIVPGSGTAANGMPLCMTTGVTPSASSKRN